ncbi:MAG: 2-phospho-L-lactate transferase, partial [Candidatus Binatota bacterium]
VSGPAHRLMAAVGYETTAFGVAKAYVDFLDIMMVASEDRDLQESIEGLGVKTVVSSIRMDSLADKRRVAREVLALVR